MMQWIISSSVLIAVVIALRFALRGKISLRMQYALWLLVLVRLLVPMSFGTSDLSVMNAVLDRLPSVQQSVTIPTENATAPAAPSVPAQNIDEPLPSDFAQNTTVADTAPTVRETDWAGIARTVWLTGTAVLGLTFLASNLRFGRKLRRSRHSIADTGVSLPVYESAETETPCLFGLIKPSIYITPDTCADADTLRYALAHEQTHYRHGDHFWAVLRGVCLALHWYNPLVWWASELSRRDAELACDEATIHALGEAERAAYGRTLIRMTCEKRPALLVTATMMTDSGKGLRERITLLVKKPKTAVYTAALVLLIAGISVACTFTGGKNDIELTDPFGREYETAEIVGCSPYYTDFTDMQMGILALAKINAEGTRTVTLSNDDSRCEYETVTEITLTREDFDIRFKSKTDGPTAWLDKSLSAEKLRRNNAKAWFCALTTAAESGWANRAYLLQQKDGTLYLVMAEEQEPSEYYPNGRNYVCFVHRLTERPMPVYDSMEDYALSRINTIRESGIVYNISDKDGNITQFSDTVEDVRVMELSCLGELSDFAPDGTLELWRFSAEAKPSNQAGNEIMLVGGQNLSDDGYFSDGYSTYLVMMHKDDGYHTLRSFISNDGYEVGRYPTVEAYLHDAYCDVSGFPGPYNLLDSLFRYTDGYGREVSDDGILMRGDGWYFYLPSGDAWIRGGIHDLWYSAYSTESTITVNTFDTTVEETAAYLSGNGWTEETSGGQTVYTRCRPRILQSSIPSFDAYESAYLYERPEGGHYEVLTVWYDRDGEVNEWGWSPKAQVAAERQQLETMVQSFTVVEQFAQTQAFSDTLSVFTAEADAAQAILYSPWPFSSVRGGLITDSDLLRELKAALASIQPVSLTLSEEDAQKIPLHCEGFILYDSIPKDSDPFQKSDYYLWNGYIVTAGDMSVVGQLNSSHSSTFLSAWNRQSRRNTERSADSEAFSDIDGLLRYAGYPSITGFTANGEELVVNSELITALQDAAQTLKTTSNPPAPTGDYVSAVLTFEGGQSVTMSVGNKAGQVRFTRDDECKITESQELCTLLYALSEARNAELHDLDNDSCCEALCWTDKNNHRNLIIYGVRDGRVERLDVNETLGCAASDYTGNIANIPQDYGNLILANNEIGKGGNLYRYHLGTLQYVTTMDEAAVGNP